MTYSPPMIGVPFELACEKKRYGVLGGYKTALRRWDWDAISNKRREGAGRTSRVDFDGLIILDLRRGEERYGDS